ncbi:MAG: CPBP family intramembrane glutamic endopeptidase [Armatimonadota bacterium]
MSIQETGPSRAKYTALFILTLAILVGLGLFSRLGRGSKAMPGPPEEALQADASMKAYYFSSHLLPGDGEELRKGAISAYRKAFKRNPSAYVARRLVVIDEPSDRYLAKLGPTERAMWRNIYGGGIPPSAARDYASRIRRMHLGWYEHLALADLYHRAGMPKEAEREQQAAMSSALATTLGLSVLFLIVFLLGATGLGLGIWYLSRGRMNRRPMQIDGLPSERREVTAEVLLEIFIVTILIDIVVQVLVGGIAGAFGARGASAEIALTAATYVIWGVLSFAYLNLRLSALGLTYRSIGFTSTQPGKDVLWGIGGYAVSLPALFVAGLISRTFERYVYTPPNPIVPLLMESGGWIDKLIIFFLLVVAAPLVEETLFRGVLANSIRAGWGTAAGIILSALIFAVVHPLPLGLLPIFALGSIFAVLMVERGSLLPGMVAHGLNNAFAFIALMLLS